MAVDFMKNSVLENIGAEKKPGYDFFKPEMNLPDAPTNFQQLSNLEEKFQAEQEQLKADQAALEQKVSAFQEEKIEVKKKMGRPKKVKNEGEE